MKVIEMGRLCECITLHEKTITLHEKTITLNFITKSKSVIDIKITYLNENKGIYESQRFSINIGEES